jgi:hypothetical protein
MKKSRRKFTPDFTPDWRRLCRKFQPKVKADKENRTVRITDRKTYKKVEILVGVLSRVYNFKGDHRPYGLYKKAGVDGDVYCLVHSDFEDSDFDSFEHYDSTLMGEAKIMHEALIKSSLGVDYFFIMPYHNNTPGGSYLGCSRGNVLVTNEI